MILLLFLISQISFAANYSVKGGDIRFIAKASPGNISIEGKGAKPTGKISIDGESAQGEVSTNLSELSTGITLRDQHLKEKYLQVGHFPKAILKIEKIDLKENTFSGKLILHGVENPVQASFTQTGDQIESRFTIKNSDYQIEKPSFLGVTVKDEVQIFVSLYIEKT